jgi:hypothetical protein
MSTIIKVSITIPEIGVWVEHENRDGNLVRSEVTDHVVQRGLIIGMVLHGGSQLWFGAHEWKVIG